MKKRFMAFWLAIIILLFLFLVSSCSATRNADPTFNFPITLNHSADVTLSSDTSSEYITTYEINGIDELISQCPIIVLVTIDEIDYSWSQSISCGRYKCIIEKEYTSNLDLESVENGYFYLYDDVCYDAWEIGEHYIFFLDSDIKYAWPHVAYYPFVADGLWGVEDDGDIILYYNRLRNLELYSATSLNYDYFISEYELAAPIEPNAFTSVNSAVNHADDVLSVEIKDIVGGYNDYVRKYTFTVKNVFKTSTGFTSGKDFSIIGPYREELEIGDTIVVMYETKETGPHYLFSYEYSFTSNSDYVHEVYSIYNLEVQ